MLAITREQAPPDALARRGMARASTRPRPRTAALRIDAVAVVLDDRDQLVALEQYEDVA